MHSTERKVDGTFAAGDGVEEETWELELNDESMGIFLGRNECDRCGR